MKKTDADFLQFLHIAFGSASELETQVIIALRHEYISQDGTSSKSNDHQIYPIFYSFKAKASQIVHLSIYHLRLLRPPSHATIPPICRLFQGTVSENFDPKDIEDNAMAALSIYILCLVPLRGVARDSREHAKQGVIVFAAWLIGSPD